jgi:hypothetical protein
VGKTTLINRLKQELARHPSPTVLCAVDPVRIQTGMTSNEFRAEVLRTLLLIRAGLLKEGSTESREERTFWHQVARRLHGEERPTLSLHQDLVQAFAYLARRGTRRTLVHVNNLENLSLDNAVAAKQLVQNVRDDLMIPDSHWLFAGATAVVQTVITEAADHVRGIFVPIELAPLSPPEVGELLTRRYKVMRKGMRSVDPVTIEAAQQLYELYRGDLRNFLRLLSSAVHTTVFEGAATPLTIDDVIRSVRPEYRRRVAELFTTDDLSYLQRLVASLTNAHFSEADIQDKTRGVGLSQSAASRLIDRFEEKRVCALDSVEGRKKWYRWQGDTVIAFGG